MTLVLVIEILRRHLLIRKIVSLKYNRKKPIRYVVRYFVQGNFRSYRSGFSVQHFLNLIREIVFGFRFTFQYLMCRDLTEDSNIKHKIETRDAYRNEKKEA